MCKLHKIWHISLCVEKFSVRKQIKQRRKCSVFVPNTSRGHSKSWNTSFWITESEEKKKKKKIRQITTKKATEMNGESLFFCYMYCWPYLHRSEYTDITDIKINHSKCYIRKNALKSDFSNSLTFCFHFHSFGPSCNNPIIFLISISVDIFCQHSTLSWLTVWSAPNAILFFFNKMKVKWKMDRKRNRQKYDFLAFIANNSSNLKCIFDSRALPKAFSNLKTA